MHFDTSTIIRNKRPFCQISLLRNSIRLIYRPREKVRSDSQPLPDKDDMDSPPVFAADPFDNHGVAADPSGMIAVGTDTRCGARKLHVFSAVVSRSNPEGVLWGGNFPNPLESPLYILYNLICACNDDDLLWTKNHCSHPVPACIGIYQFPIQGDGIRPDDKHIREERLSLQIFLLFALEESIAFCVPCERVKDIVLPPFLKGGDNPNLE